MGHSVGHLCKEACLSHSHMAPRDRWLLSERAAPHSPRQPVMSTSVYRDQKPLLLSGRLFGHGQTERLENVFVRILEQGWLVGWWLVGWF